MTDNEWKPIIGHVDSIVTYFSQSPLPIRNTRMTRDEWLDCRMEFARLAMRCSVAEFATVCRRWLDAQGRE